jgi:pimeloyl-ACP methyl ester carboxylesterase
MEIGSPDGTRIGCEVVGDGPPLLAIHGTTADRGRWAAVRDALAGRFRLHLMDRRGRGLSADEAPGDYSIEREAQDIRALVAAIGPRLRFLLGSESPGHLHASTWAAHAAAPGSELRELPGHGHDAMDADPARFVAEVDAWLGQAHYARG